jgi:Zn-dependent protease
VTSDPVTLIGIAVVVVLSITTHESAHGFVADRLGDPTARMLGRLTLNPIPHIDLTFTILLPALLLLSGSRIIFGGAKPVPVDVRRLRQPRRDWALVGLAGPLSNLTIAAGLSAALSVLAHAGLLAPSSRGSVVLVVGIVVNVLLAVFNLIPIPPLDGSRVLQYYLSGEALAAYRRLEQFGLLVILALVFFVPPVQALLTTAIFWTVEALAAVFHILPEVAFVLGA